MLYTLGLLSLLSLLIIISNFHNSFARWLVGLYLSFCLSIVGFVFYSVYFWDYYYLRNLFFDINKRIWLLLYSLHLSSYAISRIVNIGVASFYYFALCFSVSYAEEARRPLRFYLLAALLPLQLMILYDPYVGNELYVWFTTLWTKYNRRGNFFTLLKYLKVFNRLWFAVYLGYSCLSLVRRYRRLANPYIKHKALGVLASVFTTFLLFLMMFYWAPEHIVIIRGNLPAAVYDYSFEAYASLGLHQSLLYYVYPGITLIAFLALLYALYKYNVLEFMDLHQSFRRNTSFQIEQMSSAVSHMIKNRLVEIKYLLNTPQQKEGKTKPTILSICRDISQRLDELNAKTRAIKLHFHRIDIHGILSSLVSQFKDQRKNIHLIYRPGSHPLICYADRRHLREVMVNLINNALEAIGDRPGEVIISAHLEQMWNVISIADNGPGMSRKQAKGIFSPFFSTKPTSKNWGIGLTYCYKTIKAHKGRITVDSASGQGARFNILLPIIPNR